MRHLLYSFAVILGVTMLGAPSQAQTTGGFVIEVPDINNFAGGGIGVVPDYIGSDDYTIGIAPVARIQIGDGERNVRLAITELSVNVLDNEQWSLGPIFNYRLGRDDDVEDDKVKQMREIDDTIEAGVFGGWRWVSKKDPRARLLTTLSVKQDIASEHEGFLIDAGVRYFSPLTRSLVLSLGGNFTYGSSDYMDTYFGVDSRDAAATGLPRFEADGGARDVRFFAGVIQSLSINWHLGAGVGVSQLLGDASDSPVVDDRGDSTQYFAGVAAVYAW